MTLRIHRYANVYDLSTNAAGHLARRISELQNTQEVVNVAVSGGRTALDTCRSLATIYKASSLDASRLEIWWSCERWVPTTHPERVSSQTLVALAPLLPDASRVHPMPSSTGTSDPGEAAFQYADELDGVTIDISVLDVGSDAHIAAIYPDHPSFECQPALTSSVFGVTDAPGSVAEEMSMSLRMINSSAHCILLASGNEKRTAVTDSLQRGKDTPAGRVRGTKETHWFIDSEAAAGLAYHRCLF